MKAHFKLSLNPQDDYPYDVEHIVKVFADRGIEISYTDAKLAWETYSDSMSAGWMMLGENDDRIFDRIYHYFEIESDNEVYNG
jgi:hypothetical protein